MQSRRAGTRRCGGIMRIVLALGLCLGLAALSAPAFAADAPAYKLFSDYAVPARRVAESRDWTRSWA